MADTPKANEKKPPSMGLWIKLNHSILDDEKLCAIKLLPRGHFYVLTFIELLALAGKINRFGGFMLTEIRKMTIDEISNQLRIKSVDFREALQVLNEYELIVFNLDMDNCLEIMNWKKYQDLDISERKKEQDRIRQKTKRSKKNNSQDPLAQNSDQQTFSGFLETNDIDPKMTINDTPVTPMSRQSHADVAPLDTDTDSYKDSHKDYDKTVILKEKPKSSSSSIIFDEEKESVIKKYVEAKFLNGEILTTPKRYEKGVRGHAAKDKEDFDGMSEYIKLIEKKSSQKQKKVAENLSKKRMGQIDDAKNHLKDAQSLRILELPESEREAIEKQAMENIRSEYPGVAKPNQKVVGFIFDSEIIKVYNDILRHSLFETTVKEKFCFTGEVSDIDRLDFTIDFAVANELSMDAANFILTKHKIEPPQNYSILYKDKENISAMLSVYSQFGWFKNGEFPDVNFTQSND